MKPLDKFGIEIKEGKYHEAAIYGVACAYALMEKKISDYLRGFKLTPAKFNALMVIKHKGKESGLSQIEIGRSLIVSASNMTRLLDKLEKEGFVERLSQKGDRRVNLVKISKKGSVILDKAWPGYHKGIMEVSSLLNTEELKELSRLIIKWCSRLEEE